MLFHYESDNLLYDVLLEDDAGRILDFYQFNKDIFEPFDPDKSSNFYTLEYQTAMAKAEHENFLRGKSARYWISRKNQPHVLIGCVSFNNIIKGSFQSCTIGYKIHKNHHGQGYATEAVLALCEKMFDEGHLHRIEAYIQLDNKPSIALAEKCGFRFEGISREYAYMKGKWVDHLHYSLISSSLNKVYQ